MAINSRSSRKSSWVQVGVILGLSSILLAISSVSSRESSQGQVRGPVRVKSGQVGVKSGSSRGQVGVKSGSSRGHFWVNIGQNEVKLGSSLTLFAIN